MLDHLPVGRLIIEDDRIVCKLDNGLETMYRYLVVGDEGVEDAGV